MENIFFDYYKRKDIQEEMLYNAKDREVVAKFHDSFSKRPDVLKYPNDILELAKQGATSFHASEELWKNPLQLHPNLKRHELDALRIGWDLIIDIDCPYWEYSKLIAKFIIDSLKEHKVKSISCKFSGNKGFHIGIPFEAFPNVFNKKETRLMFPEYARLIASYLVHHIDIKERFTNAILSKGMDNVIEKTGKQFAELVMNVCNSCGIEVKGKKLEFICRKCGYMENTGKNEPLRKCKKCNSIMDKKIDKAKCPKCKRTEFKNKFNTKVILNIDSILISPRHLYRMPYSLHESTGLVSLPIDINNVMGFQKTDATPELVKCNSRFLEKIGEGDAFLLFDEALKWNSCRKRDEALRLAKKTFKTFLTTEIPEEFFPPCIKLINEGLEDGRKRALFVLINFYTSIGWNYEEIEKKLIEWNNKNKEPLRMNYLISQLRYHKQMKKKILPPNCDNEMYMVGIGVCKPDNFCPKIRNPANYSIKKSKKI